MINVKFLVVTAITLALGVYVFYAVFDAMPAGQSTAENTTRDAIKDNFGTAFRLSAIIGIVMGAAWILRVLDIL